MRNAVKENRKWHSVLVSTKLQVKAGAPTECPCMDVKMADQSRKVGKKGWGRHQPPSAKQAG